MRQRDPYHDVPERVSRGDLSALHEVLDRYGSTVMALMWRAIDGYGTRNDLEELMIEVGAQAYYRIQRFVPSSKHPTVSAWLHDLAREVAADFVQRRKKRRR
jgi:DNA-directed RNA polymerase specialized sigma24 family protein